MKAFNTPVIEIEKLDIVDVITTSDDISNECPRYDPMCPSNVCPED